MGQPVHRTTAASHLLTAARMPSPAGGTAWRIADRGRENAVVGACQKTDLQTIGAISVVRRSFASGPDGPWATQVVAQFADARSAWRAHEVLAPGRRTARSGWTSTARRSGRCAPWTSAAGPARAT
jgi:hypothetical protein